MCESTQTAPGMAPGDQPGVGRPETGSRRAAVRNLAGALLALAAGGASVVDARQKRKKKGKGKSRKKRNTCRVGRIVASLAVPSDGSEISTPSLKQGQRYTLRASGFWSTNGEFMNDAVAAFPFANPALPTFTDGGCDWGFRSMAARRTSGAHTRKATSTRPPWSGGGAASRSACRIPVTRTTAAC